MKMQLIMENWRKFSKKASISVPKDTQKLLLEVEQEIADEITASIGKVPIEARAGASFFGTKWRLMKPFSSAAETLMREIHAFLVDKKYTLTPKEGEVEVTRQARGDKGGKITKKELRWSLNYVKQEKGKKLPEDVIAGIAAGKIKPPKGYNPSTGKISARKGKPISIQKALGKFKNEVEKEKGKGAYNKWIKFLGTKPFEYFTKGKKDDQNKKNRGNYKNFLSDEVNVYVIYTRHPIDIVRMSDFEELDSCHAPNDAYFKDAIKEAVGTGGGIAFYVDKNHIDHFLQEEHMSEEAFLDMHDIFADPCRAGLPENLPVPHGRIKIRHATISTSTRMNPEGDTISLLLPEQAEYGQVPAGAGDRLAEIFHENQEDRIGLVSRALEEELGGAENRKRPSLFLEKVRKKLKSSFGFFKKDLLESLQQIGELKVRDTNVAHFFNRPGTHILDNPRDFHVLVQDIFQSFPESFVEKIRGSSDSLGSSDPVAKIEASIEVLKKIQKNTESVEGPIDGSGLQSGPQYYSIMRNPGDLIRAHAPKTLVKKTQLEDSEFESFKKTFIRKAQRPPMIAADVIFGKFTVKSRSQVLQGMELKGGKYTDTGIEKLLQNLVDKGESSVKMYGFDTWFDWSDDFWKIYKEVVESEMKPFLGQIKQILDKNRKFFDSTMNKLESMNADWPREMIKFFNAHLNERDRLRNYLPSLQVLEIFSPTAKKLMQKPASDDPDEQAFHGSLLNYLLFYGVNLNRLIRYLSTMTQNVSPGRNQHMWSELFSSTKEAVNRGLELYKSLMREVYTSFEKKQDDLELELFFKAKEELERAEQANLASSMYGMGHMATITSERIANIAVDIFNRFATGKISHADLSQWAKKKNFTSLNQLSNYGLLDYYKPMENLSQLSILPKMITTLMSGLFKYSATRDNVRLALEGFISPLLTHKDMLKIPNETVWEAIRHLLNEYPFGAERRMILRKIQNDHLDKNAFLPQRKPILGAMARRGMLHLPRVGSFSGVKDPGWWGPDPALGPTDPEEKKKPPKEKKKPSEEDEYVWGGISENKKPRKRRILKVKIKGGK